MKQLDNIYNNCFIHLYNNIIINNNQTFIYIDDIINKIFYSKNNK